MTMERERAVQTVRTSLMRRASPRAHMLLLVSVTAAAGFATSYLLLHAGLTLMALRYPLAVGVGYLAFLGLVRLWLRRFRLRARVTRRERGAQVDLDVLEFPIDQLFTAGPAPEPQWIGFGHGGGFSGAGGGTSWGDGSPTFASSAVSPAPSGGSGVSAGGAWDLDLDEGALWLIPIAIIVAIALGVVTYLVYLAPTLFAEMLLDAGLAAGLYHRLLRTGHRSWLTTAVRNTVIPACFVAALLALAGTIMQGVYPDAVSIGGIVRHLQVDDAPKVRE
jgi:hypothetical protein